MNKKIINIMLTGIFLTALVSAADFRSFKRDLKRSGAVTEQAWGVLMQKLEKKLAKAAVTSPIVYKGLVFFGDSSGMIYAFDASGENSTPVWQYATAGKVASSMVADNGVVYAISQDGNLYAFKYLTGELLFKYNIGSQDSSSPAVYAGCLYGATGHPNKIVYCFNLTTRAMVWSKDVGQYVQSSPAFGDGIVYIGASNGRLYAFDAYTGEIKWFFQTKGGVYLSSPCVSADGNWVYFLPGNDDRKIYALNAKTGELKTGWASLDFGTIPTVVSSITEEDGVIYFVSGDKPSTLYAVNEADGTQKAGFTPAVLGDASKAGILSSPVIVNGIIYVGSASNKLYAVDAANGAIIGTYTTKVPVLSSPAVANGKVYLCAGDIGEGWFYVYQAEKVSALTYPEDGSTVNGTLAVKGVLVNSALKSYKLEYSLGNTNTWVKINEADTIPADGVVGSINTNELAEGTYSLRLTANDETALNSKGVISFIVNNVASISPLINAAAGGSFAAPDGTEAIFKAGALTADDTVTIDKPATGSGTCPNTAYPLNFTASGVARSFVLGNPGANAIFKNTVTIIIPYTALEIAGMEAKNLRIAVWDTGKLKWAVVNTSKVYVDENKVTATVSHFSVYRIFEFKPGSQDLISKESVYAYPNPAKGDIAVFKCFLGYDATINISVYNVAGELVRELTASGLGGNGVEIPWDIKDYASGVYIFKLEAVATDVKIGRKYVTKKLAIIH